MDNIYKNTYRGAYHILPFSSIERKTYQWLAEGGGGFESPPTPQIPKAFQNRAKLNPIVKT